MSYSYQNQLVNSLKLYFGQEEKTWIQIDKLERPRRQHKLPNVLSKEEIKAILEAPTNLKHRNHVMPDLRLRTQTQRTVELKK